MDFEKQNNSFLFQYGPTAGQDDFREALATFLSDNYGSLVKASNLILTAGASNGMHLLWTLLLHPTSLVIVDEVTYMIALESLANFPGFKVVSCPLLDDGPDLNALEEILLSHGMDEKVQTATRYHCMYYTIPAFHNPTGIIFSEKKCRDLVGLSRRLNFLVACDDVYNLLAEGKAQVPRLIALDSTDDEMNKGTVISNGSFSKIFAPGVRVGWIECPVWINKVLQGSGILKSGGAVNNYTSGIMATIMQSGQMQKTLDYYKSEYQVCTQFILLN